MPAPDPSPSAVAPDPPPEAVSPPAATKPIAPSRRPLVRATSQPAAVAPAAPARRSRARGVAPRPEPKPEVVETEPVVRDSTPMPRAPRATFSPAAEALERGLLVAAGIALVVVALGGAVVLLAGRRAFAGARA
jgi:hypothetical protein